jgi:hypothetical protein
MISRRTLLTTLAALPLCGWMRPKESQMVRPETALPRLGAPWPEGGFMWAKTITAISPGCRGVVVVCNYRGEPTQSRASVVNGFNVGIHSDSRITAVGGGTGKWIIVSSEV